MRRLVLGEVLVGDVLGANIDDYSGAASAIRHDLDLVAILRMLPDETAEHAGARVGILPQRDELVVGLDLEQDALAAEHVLGKKERIIRGVRDVVLLALGSIGAAAGGAIGKIWGETSRAEQYRASDRDFSKLPKHSPRHAHHNGKGNHESFMRARRTTAAAAASGIACD